MQLQHFVAAAILAVVSSSQVSPVAKVISLLEGMKTEIETEGKAEAATYAKFACFCKDSTAKKAKSITEGQDKIDTLSAAIAQNTATRAADETSIQNLKAKKNALSADLEANTVRCAKEKAEYEGYASDFNKAISSLKSAIKAMADKKQALEGVAASALLDTGSSIRETLELADAMGLVKAQKQKAFIQGFSAFLQGGSQDPGGYKYHSQDIVDLLQSLEKDFKKEKAELDTEWGKTDAACTAVKSSLSGKIETNTKETKTTDEKINKLGASIADDRGQLVEAQDLMKDDEQYLKELTSRCESRAGEFDQRSGMRADEIKAISTALEVLGTKVKAADEKVNVRALLLTKKTAVLKEAKPAVAETTKKAAVQKPVPKTAVVAKTPVAKAAAPKAAPAVAPKAVAAAKAMPSFLQKAVVGEHAHGDLSAVEAIAKQQAVDAIKNAGIHLKSPVLTALAMQVAADPFKKVKELIQGLVERLVKEAASEATKKGFCDTELGKAEKERQFRWTRVQKLGADIAVAQAKEDQLKEELTSLSSSLTVLDKGVKDSAELRKDEKEENAKTVATAREGLAAVNEALLLLRDFYKQAAKAAFLQASPVDEDTSGAGFSGTYGGKQESSNAVLSLLQTIAADFERTIRSTESSEDQAAKAYVKFTRVTKSDIGGKTTKKALNEQDLKTIQNQLQVDRADMKTNMNLVDDAVKTLVELKPTCIDTGMSFSDRVAKREEEVKALKKAICILDTEKVEEMCK